MKHYTHSRTLQLLLTMLAIVIMVFTVQMLPTGQLKTANAAALAQKPVTGNPIQRENLLPGTPDWRITNPSPLDPRSNSYVGIEGYSSVTSVAAGNTISFAVNTNTTTFNADIYRLGWYQGSGARLEQTLSGLAGHSYSIPAPRSRDGLVQANWPSAFAITIPSTWVSGEYLVKLTNANGLQGYIPFVVKSYRKSDFVFIHSVNTDEAYNTWGGTSLYQDLTQRLAVGRAYKVSFDRPFSQFYGAGHIFYWEYPMIRWLEKNGYDVSYISDLDANNSSTILQGHHGVLVVGHSEYWSGSMRSHLQAAISSGVNLGAFGGNQIYWQVRYESSSTHVPNRVMTCYKDASLDPLNNINNNAVTVEWRSQPVTNAEQILLGSMSSSMVSQGYPWVVNNAASWVFAGTNLQNGDSIPGLVGYEYDRVFTTVPFAYPTPTTITGADGVDGVEVLSASPVTDTYNNADVSNSTLYTAPGGARVFNAGTIQWSWGLDDYESATALSTAAQQITANILHNFVTGSTTAATLG